MPEPVVLAVAPNPALDVTYELAELRPGQVHRVGTVRERAGGKAVNVARVLHQLGKNVVLSGLAGGTGGHTLRAGLEAAGIRAELLDLLPDVRRTLVVQETSGMTTSLWEPGHRPADPPATAAALARQVATLLPRVDALVVAGSLPPGLDPELPARLVGLATAAGLPAVVDLADLALRAVVTDGRAVVVPNLDEVTELLGSRPGTPAEAVRAVRRLVSPHGPAPAVVLTLGAEGMAVVRPDQVLLARPPQRIEGNPTGAGDAACAAVAKHLAAARSVAAVDWARLLADAVALSAAAVLRPVAGEVDLDAYRRWRERVTVERW